MLPSSESLAVLVSKVTETMCATSFQPEEPAARGDSLCGKMVMLPIEGPRDIRLVLAYDNRGATALATRMFGVPAGSVTGDLLDDAIRELLNMIGGQISTALSLDQTLGLPRPTNLAEMAQSGDTSAEDAVLLRSSGNVDLRLWILEKAPAEGGRPAGSFRSLLSRSLLGSK
jgi:hypothetical protein